MTRIPQVLGYFSTLLFIVQIAMAAHQSPDPLLGLILGVENDTRNVGGNLQVLSPRELRTPPAKKESPVGGVAFLTDYSDYFRTGGMEAAGASFRRRTSLEGWLASGNVMPWKICTGISGNRERIELIQPDYIQNASLGSRNSQGWLSGSLRYNRVNVYGRLELQERGQGEEQISAGVDFNQWGAFAAGFERQTVFSKLEARQREQYVGIQIHAGQEKITGWIRSPILWGFQYEAKLKESKWKRNAGIRSTATLEPWGNEREYHSCLFWRREEGVFGIGTRGGTVDLQAYGVQAGIPYSKITQCNMDWNTQFISLKLHNSLSDTLILELEHLDWVGYARGHVEFWPFTAGLIDLLGLRRYFIGETGGFLWRLHLAKEGGGGRKWKAAYGLNLMDIHPDFALQRIFPHKEVKYQLVFCVYNLR